MKRKTGLIILGVALVIVIIDAFITNSMIAKQNSWYAQGLIDSAPNLEVNPLLKSIAGTVWLYVIKVGWVLMMMAFILILKDRKLSLRNYRENKVS